MISSIKNFFNSKWHKQLFIYALYVSYIMIFISLTGAVSWAPEYLSIIQKYIIYYISILLIGRFNPFMNKTIVYDLYDRKVYMILEFTRLHRLKTNTIYLYLFSKGQCPLPPPVEYWLE